MTIEYNTLTSALVLALALAFYRAMHFSAKCGIAIIYCPSVRPFVCNFQVSGIVIT